MDRKTYVECAGLYFSLLLIVRTMITCNQSQLREGGKPLCITLYADKTCLSSFGTAQGYPIMAQIGNLPQHIRNGKGLGSTQVVGWLPIVGLLVSCYHNTNSYSRFLRRSLIKVMLLISSEQCGTNHLKFSLKPYHTIQLQDILCSVEMIYGVECIPLSLF
jgi:hypothetical protein